MYVEKSFSHPYSVKRTPKNLSGTLDGDIDLDEFIDYLWAKLDSYGVSIDTGNSAVDAVLGFFKWDRLSISDIAPFGLHDFFLSIAKEKLKGIVRDSLALKKEAKPDGGTLSKALVTKLWDELETTLEVKWNSEEDQIDLNSDTGIKTSIGLWDALKKLTIIDIGLYIVGSMKEDDPKVITLNYIADNIARAGFCGFLVLLFSKKSAFGSATRDWVINKIASFIQKGIRFFCIEVLGVPASEFALPAMGSSGPGGDPSGNVPGTVNDSMFPDNGKANRDVAKGISEEAFEYTIKNIGTFNDNYAGDQFKGACILHAREKINEMWPITPGTIRDGRYQNYMVNYCIGYIRSMANREEYMKSHSVSVNLLAVRQRYQSARTLTLDQIRSVHQGGSGIPMLPVIAGGIGLVLLLKYFKK